MFLGSVDLRLDEKGRLFLPSRWRARFADGLVLTKGQERCVFVFTTEVFTDKAAALADAPLSDRRARDYGRVLFASAADETPDKQGRVTVAPALREWAGLDRDVTLVGAGRRVELWDPQTWQTYTAEREASFAEVADAVPGLL